MPVLKNPQWEQFALGVANGLKPGPAYKDAGYRAKDASKAGSRLLKNDEILARVKELRAAISDRAVQKASLTRTYVIDRLMTNVDRCMQLEEVKDEKGNVVALNHNPNAANRALELLGKEIGMFIERKEVGRPNEFKSKEDLENRRREVEEEIEELRKQIAEGGATDGASGTVH